MKEINPAPQIRELSVEAWRELCGQDADVPVRIQLYGRSMQPLIRFRRDYVTVRALTRPPRRGDIVLFQRGDGRYVIHRIRNLDGEMVQTLGDNCAAPDRPIRTDELLGLVTYVHRDGRDIHVDSPLWRSLGRLWALCLPARTLARRTLGPVKRAITQLFRR